MKQLLIGLFVVILLLFGCKAQGEQQSAVPADSTKAKVDNSVYKPGDWITDYNLALQYAKDLKHPILVDFTGSDWCGWCMKLDAEVFSQKAFQDYAKNELILLKVDFPRKNIQTQEQKAANLKLQDKFEIDGYPTIILLNETGVEIGRTGYQDGGADNYVSHLKSILASKEDE
jgi:protein disulfide-isomerase